MPNWCSNSITIVDLSKEQVEELIKHIGENEGRFFQCFKPRPQHEDENWYDWNIKEWGTKWDACYTCVSGSGDDWIVILFETAWAPPIALYTHMYQNGYNFYADFSEPMMGFEGNFQDGMEESWETLTED